MRRLFRAGLVSVCVASVMVVSACGSEDLEDERAPSPSGVAVGVDGVRDPGGEGSASGAVAPGSELMGQEAPPAVGRPVTGGGPGPRMIAGETPGRWPFYWTRAVYSGGRGWYSRRSAWATDFPKGDRQFLVLLKRLVRLDAYDWENPVELQDPDLRRFPVIYAVEVGHMRLTEPEVEGLRTYLEAGGFLIVDDFWGAEEWARFEWNMARVFPDRPIEDIPMDHPLFSTLYEIEEILQVPNIGNARRGGRTGECWGPCPPKVRGIFDDDRRLMAVINWNTDLGDAWEWAEDPSYPLVYSTFASKMAANMIVYGLSH